MIAGDVDVNVAMAAMEIVAIQVMDKMEKDMVVAKVLEMAKAEKGNEIQISILTNDAFDAPEFGMTSIVASLPMKKRRKGEEVLRGIVGMALHRQIRQIRHINQALFTPIILPQM